MQNEQFNNRMNFSKKSRIIATKSFGVIEENKIGMIF
jgi:hypothetical protein